MKKICENCNLEFSASLSRNKFCSVKCFSASKRKNRAPIIEGSVTKIPLTPDGFVVIDTEDLSKVENHLWVKRIMPNGKCYANFSSNGKRGAVHRLVMGVTDPKIEVDHIDNDGLNCRKSNLRLCTHLQNHLNKGKRKDSKQKYKCIEYRYGKYRPYININGKRTVLGLFDSPEEAAKIYDKKAVEIHGEFANTNFPKQISL